MSLIEPSPHPLMTRHDPDAAIIGQNIKLLRTQRGWTQSDLAHHLGVRQSQVGNYEQGLSNPSLTVLKKLSQILEVSIDALVFPERPDYEIQDRRLYQLFVQADGADFATQGLIKQLLAKLLLNGNADRTGTAA